MPRADIELSPTAVCLSAAPRAEGMGVQLACLKTCPLWLPINTATTIKPQQKQTHEGWELLLSQSTVLLMHSYLVLLCPRTRIVAFFFLLFFSQQGHHCQGQSNAFLHHHHPPQQQPIIDHFSPVSRHTTPALAILLLHFDSPFKILAITSRAFRQAPAYLPYLSSCFFSPSR